MRKIACAIDLAQVAKRAFLGSLIARRDVPWPDLA